MHEQLRVLLLHALDVHRTRRGALLERVPQQGVLALMVGVQAGREHREVVGHDVGVDAVALGDADDELAALAEPGLEHAVDLGHAARIAGLGHGNGCAGGLGGTAGCNRCTGPRACLARVLAGRHWAEARSQACRLRSVG